MLWTIIGLAIPTIVSIEGATSSERSRQIKQFLIALALAGFGIAIGSAFHENLEKQRLENRARELQKSVDAANQKLSEQSVLLTLVNSTVGDLGALNRLSGGSTYYVQIAADTSKERLEGYLRRIENQFAGAKSSGLVTVRDPKPGSSNYLLVFGAGLDLTAAEVFQRLANNHHFPPDSQIATIQRESGK
jgi:hypothetical protein